MKKIFVFLIIISILVTLAYFNFSKRVIVVSNFDDYQLRNNDKEIIDLKVLTYNIHHGVGLDGKLDLARIANVIKESNADIIGLNEIDVVLQRTGFKNQVSYFAKVLGMNYAYGASIKSYPGSYGNAILSKYPIINTENYILPMIKQESEEPRSLLKAEIKISEDKTIYILLTHLSLDKDERKEQVKWISEFIKGLEKPYLVMGDFNAEADEVLNYIDDENSGLKSLTKGIKTYPASNSQKGIDSVFSATQFEVMEKYSLKTNASDHLPVFLSLMLNH